MSPYLPEELRDLSDRDLIVVALTRLDDIMEKVKNIDARLRRIELHVGDVKGRFVGSDGPIITGIFSRLGTLEQTQWMVRGGIVAIVGISGAVAWIINVLAKLPWDFLNHNTPVK